MSKIGGIIRESSELNPFIRVLMESLVNRGVNCDSFSV